jgi:acyl-CoA reductase-like NAD-dependent aldehyde dehydrogenase
MYIRSTIFIGGQWVPSTSSETVEVVNSASGNVVGVVPSCTVDDSLFGLHGGVWASTDEEALAFARRMRTGQVDVNGGPFNVDAPFGGFKQSGIGRELGPLGLEEFYETKAIQMPA